MNPVDILSSQFDCYYGDLDSEYVGSLTPIGDQMRTGDTYRYHPPDKFIPSTSPEKTHNRLPTVSTNAQASQDSSTSSAAIGSPVQDKSVTSTRSFPIIHLRHQSMPTELPSYESYERFISLPPDTEESNRGGSDSNPTHINKKIKQNDGSVSPNYNLVIDIHVHGDKGTKKPPASILDNDLMSKSLQTYEDVAPTRTEEKNSLEQLNGRLNYMKLDSEHMTSLFQPNFTAGMFEFEGQTQGVYNWRRNRRTQHLTSNGAYGLDWSRRIGRSTSIPMSHYQTPNGRTDAPDRLIHQKRYPDIPQLLYLLESLDPNVIINATACLQHSVYRNSNLKEKTRQLGGIALLIRLLYSDNTRICQNAIGVLRNLTCGDNLEIKEEVQRVDGIKALAWLIRRCSKRTFDRESGSVFALDCTDGKMLENIVENASAVMCNLAFIGHLKLVVLRDAIVTTLVPLVIQPVAKGPLLQLNEDRIGQYSVPNFNSISFRNASAVIRNVSSSTLPEVREQLRECPLLLVSLLTILRTAIHIRWEDAKCVEHCICIIRNLCFFTQRGVVNSQFSNGSVNSGVNTSSIFGSKSSLSTRRFRSKLHDSKINKDTIDENSLVRSESMMNLFHRESNLQIIIDLLQTSSNPTTLEAAAGTIQNLTSLDCPNSIPIQSLFRKLQVLPVLVELINSPSRRVSTSVINALSNLARDEQNCNLLGKHGSISILTALRNCCIALSTTKISQTDKRTGNTEEWRLPNEGQIGSLLHLTRPQNQKCSQSIFSARAVVISLLCLCHVLICDDMEQARRFVTLGVVDICQDLLSITGYCDDDDDELMKPIHQKTAQLLRRLWSFVQLKPIYKLAGWSAEDFGVYKRSGRFSSLVRRRQKHSTSSSNTSRSSTPMCEDLDSNSRSSSISRAELERLDYPMQPTMEHEGYSNALDQMEFDSISEDTITNGEDILFNRRNERETQQPNWIPREWLTSERPRRIYIPSDGYNNGLRNDKQVQRSHKQSTHVQTPHLVSQSSHTQRTRDTSVNNWA